MRYHIEMRVPRLSFSLIISNKKGGRKRRALPDACTYQQ
jgi:hypothetical protein